MKKKITVLLSLIIFLLTNAQKRFQITGNLSGFEENSFAKITKNNMTLDSCIIKNGEFALNGTLQNEPSSVVLLISNGTSYRYSELFIGNASIRINAKKEDFKWNVKTEGSKYDNLRFKYFKLIKALNEERSQYESQVASIRDNSKWNDSLQITYWSQKQPFGKIILVDKKLEEINKKFITDNINQPYGLYLLDSNKSVLSKSFVSNSVKNLNPKLKNNLLVKSINSYLYNPDLKIGDSFYNFSAIDQNGRKVKFSDYFMQKFVLLDFSTLYCGFCIQSIPTLNQLKKEKGNKLEIVTFYVDQDLKGFEKLHKKHHSEWIILRDKDGRSSETYSKYKVDGTPVFYLFGPDGTLIKKIDGFDEEMEELIKKNIGS